MLVPEGSEKIRYFGAGKEEKTFRGECTHVLDQENFCLTQPAPEPSEGRAAGAFALPRNARLTQMDRNAQLFLTENFGSPHTAEAHHQTQKW